MSFYGEKRTFFKAAIIYKLELYFFRFHPLLFNVHLFLFSFFSPALPLPSSMLYIFLIRLFTFLTAHRISRQGCELCDTFRYIFGHPDCWSTNTTNRVPRAPVSLHLLAIPFKAMPRMHIRPGIHLSAMSLALHQRRNF